ncbi:hypothetical protein M1105_12855 [Limibaculum sp. FT325]|uniref:hypothetical protein n=1 Tax=Thermohalobaculum sediminis TaxID=2939436 RepID=UPI0020BE72DD|nr:hypothetical protein [Limibaculum sediminis]MCL5777872.1 hypothetical protein [Limibaculum sediminis]
MGTGKRHMLRVLAALVALVWVQAAAEAQVADTLGGRYEGMADAAGAAIEIAPDAEGFRGTFHDAAGRRQRFSADRVGDTAEAVLDMDGRTVLMRMSPLPFGAEVALVPFAADGTLDIPASRIVNFVREGLAVPQLPEDYVPAPDGSGGRIAALSFLVSYEFWAPAGVRNGFMALAPRHRTLIRLFPAVQLDVVWKLCLAPGAEEALGVALRGQGVNCAEVLDGIAEAQRTGRFDAYKAEVAKQGAQLRTAVRCADNYVMSKQICDRAAQDVSRAAMSLETAATVLRRYR